MKEAVHLIRLAALFAVGIILFLVVRQWIVPDGFGKYGHFRSGALADVRAQPISFAGRATCETCHDDIRTQLAGGKHALVNCEACHGHLANHAEDPEKVKPVLPQTQLLCPVCHEANAAKPKSFPQVISKEHSGGEECKTCHRPHSPVFGSGGEK